MSRSLNFQNLPKEKQKKLAEHRASFLWAMLAIDFTFALFGGGQLMLVVSILLAFILCIFGWSHYQKFGCFPYPWSNKNTQRKKMP